MGGWFSPGVYQLRMCSVWVLLCVHHWLINLQKHKWFESNFVLSLGLECNSKKRSFLQLKHLLARPPKNLGLTNPYFGKTVRLLHLSHRMT